MILLRHGQSEFNLHFTQMRKDPGIADPPLTPYGQAQAREAAASLVGRGIRRIIVSPYTRTLQTAAPIAAKLGVKVVVNPIVRERYAFTCDLGTPASELARAWPEHDFGHLDEVWWPVTEEPAEEVLGRAARFRAEMAALADWSDTLVVSHWGFILAMTGERAQNGEWRVCDPTVPPPTDIVWRH